MPENQDPKTEVLRAQLQADIERLRADLQDSLARWTENAVRQREEWLAEIENNRVMMRAMIDFALAAIRSLLIVNGGSAIALLALIGSVWGKDPEQGSSVAVALVPSLAWFGIGLGTSLVTSMLAFLSQFAFSELPRNEDKKPHRLGDVARFIGMLTAGFGIVCFGAGLYYAASVFSGTVGAP